MSKNLSPNFLRFSLSFFFCLIVASVSVAQTTEFLYQGRFFDGGSLANGIYDISFKLYDVESGGTPLATVERFDVRVINGIFSTSLDFGSTPFNGSQRFIEICVKFSSSPDPPTTLSPRQKMGATPQSIISLKALEANALSASCNPCVQNSNIQSLDANKLTGTVPPASIPTGSDNYIQNSITQQPASAFNISGDGTLGGNLSANIVRTQTEFQIGNNRVLGVGTGNSRNLFVGLNTGTAITTGTDNILIGNSVGLSNTTGATNIFIGNSAGLSNTTGFRNVFVGNRTGEDNITGSRNSFFGDIAGTSNTNGSDNSFFGHSSGLANNASFNSFFGAFAGSQNTTGANNAYFGESAGRLNLLGSKNSIFGSKAGENLIGSENSFFGFEAGKGDINNGSGVQNSFFGVESGRVNNGGSNAFFGYKAGNQNVSGGSNTFIGRDAGLLNRTGNLNVFVGHDAGDQNVGGNFNTAIGAGANVGNNNITGSSNTAIGANAVAGGNDIFFATAIGADAIANETATIVLGRNNGFDIVKVPGTIAVSGNLNVNGTLSKGAGSFKIDHPLDPANKFLFHSFVESPDMMNVYNGNVTTDENGLAVVELPDYFEALNRDFRYQLTVIGQFAQAIVLEEIKGNRFKIKTDKPTVKVSWQITGIRKDPFAEKNRIQVEVEKSEQERGKYLYPEIKNQPNKQNEKPKQPEQ